MNPILTEILMCGCGGAYGVHAAHLTCASCGRRIPLKNGIPLFTLPPENIRPSEKVARGLNLGTPWRQANWRFLAQELEQTQPDALILDVGAGRGDFADVLSGHQALALDVYPYPEVDLVCDLTQINPFRPASIDVILLLNVMEHVYDAHALLESLAQILKPGGRLLVAIPFMVKMHQTPLDFARYTHYTLERFAADHGFEVERLEGYYAPIFLLDEGLGNLRWAVLRELPRLRRYGVRLVLSIFSFGKVLLSWMLGTASQRVLPPSKTFSQSPTGYQIVYRKL